MLWHQVGNSQGNYTYDARFYKETNYRPHFHKNYELLYAVAGSCQATVATRQLTIDQGHFLLIPPYAIHSFTMDSSCKLWVSVFSADFVGGQNSSTIYAPFICREDIHRFLENNLIFTGTPDRLLLQACLHLVLHQCSTAPVLGTLDFDRIVQITQVVSDNLDKNITMTQAADLLGFEYHYFSRLFHSLFSMNFRQFVNLYRIEKACHILRASQADIGSIALECGFQTLRSFNRSFRELTGQTPSQYRNK